MNCTPSNPPRRALRALASVLLLAVAWLLPGLHGLWCDHGHGAEGSGASGAQVASASAVDGHGHGCEASYDHGHSAPLDPAPDEEREGHDHIGTASSSFAGCVLELLAPVPGTDLEPDLLGVGHAPLARSQLPVRSVSLRAATRHLLAPKNSPPVDDRRRQA